jgi:hypothetical protein
MKKFLALATLLVVIMTIMSFIVIIHPKTKPEKHTTTSIKKLVCDCNTPPSGVMATRTGNTVNVSWSGSYDSYSVGGYFQCGGTFTYCVTGNSFSFPASCSGTLRITGNCGTTTCTNATCSSNPSAPTTF